MVMQGSSHASKKGDVLQYIKVFCSSLLLLVFSLLSFTAQSTDYSDTHISKKDYRGVTLHILSHEIPVVGEPTVLHAQQFEQLTGAKIIIEHIDLSQLYQKALWGLKNKRYDVIFFGAIWMPDIYQYLSPVPEKMLDAAMFSDVMAHVKTLSQWNGTHYQVNIDGDRHYLQYRKSLLDNPDYGAAFKKQYGTELKVPQTWRELNQIAAFFNNKELANGKKLHGISEITNRYDLLYSQFIKRAAPYAKHPDIKDGFYFELATMKPLINTPGFVEALKEFKKSSQFYPPNGNEFGLADVIESFGRGDSVFSDSWDDPFVQAMQNQKDPLDTVAAALSPGAKSVWNRQLGRWDTFENVNYVPYLGSGWASAVAKSSLHQEASFDFLGFFANKTNHNADLAVGRYGLNPYRLSDINQQFWQQTVGWGEEAAASYVNMLNDINSTNNKVYDLRIHRSREYMKILANGVFRALSGRSSAQAALDYVAYEWEQLTTRVGRDKQRKAYAQVVLLENQ